MERGLTYSIAEKQIKRRGCEPQLEKVKAPPFPQPTQKPRKEEKKTHLLSSLTIPSAIICPRKETKKNSSEL